MDLRERVARAVAQGMSKAEVARRYEIGLSTVKRYARRQAVTGTLRPCPIPGRPRALDALAEDALRAQVARTRTRPSSSISAGRPTSRGER